MRKERKTSKTSKETFVFIKTGFPFPEEFAVEKHFFKTGLTTNISFCTNKHFFSQYCFWSFGTVQVAKAKSKNSEKLQKNGKERNVL